MSEPTRRGRPMWQVVRSLPPTPRRVVITAVATTIALATGAILGLDTYPLAVLAIGVLWVIGMHSTPPPDIDPPPEQLRRMDRAREREAEHEFVASGEGERAFEQLLADVLELTGQDVTVIVGCSDPCWRPVARITGRLRNARNIRVADDPERLAIGVGTGDVIFLDRERFARGHTTYQRTPDDALEIEDVDGVSLHLSAQVAARRP